MICQAEVDKLLKELHKSNLITADELKKLEPKAPLVPSARPTKAHKVPLKIILTINTQGSTSYKTSRLVSRELKPLVLGKIIHYRFGKYCLNNKKYKNGTRGKYCKF